MFKVVRYYQNGLPAQTIKTGLTEEEAKAHCKDPETSSSTCTSKEGIEHTKQFGAWFDVYKEERTDNQAWPDSHYKMNFKG